MKQTREISVFNEEMFPVGSCVKLLTTDGLLERNCLITRYESMNTVMVIEYVESTSKQTNIGKLNVNELNFDYTLRRLIPEKVEVESEDE